MIAFYFFTLHQYAHSSDVIASPDAVMPYTPTDGDGQTLLHFAEAVCSTHRAKFARNRLSWQVAPLECILIAHRAGFLCGCLSFS